MQKVNFPSFGGNEFDEQFPGTLRVSSLGVQHPPNREILVLQMVVKPDPENEQFSHSFAFSREAVFLLMEELNSFLTSS